MNQVSRNPRWVKLLPVLMSTWGLLSNAAALYPNPKLHISAGAMTALMIVVWVRSLQDYQKYADVVLTHDQDLIVHRQGHEEIIKLADIVRLNYLFNWMAIVTIKKPYQGKNPVFFVPDALQSMQNLKLAIAAAKRSDLA